MGIAATSQQCPKACGKDPSEILSCKSSAGKWKKNQFRNCFRDVGNGSSLIWEMSVLPSVMIQYRLVQGLNREVSSGFMNATIYMPWCCEDADIQTWFCGAGTACVVCFRLSFLLHLGIHNAITAALSGGECLLKTAETTGCRWKHYLQNYCP